MKLTKNIKRSTGLILIALFVFFAWPIKSLQCPIWDVIVVDETGKPLPAMTVQMSYQNYSAEEEAHEVMLTTDSSGHVQFPSMVLTASRMKRIWVSMKSVRADVHASFGPHVWVWAYGHGKDGMAVNNGYVTDWTGSPDHMDSRIVVKSK